MSRDVAYRNGYLPLFAGAELIRRSGSLTQFPAENLIGTLPPVAGCDSTVNYGGTSKPWPTGSSLAGMSTLSNLTTQIIDNAGLGCALWVDQLEQAMVATGGVLPFVPDGTPLYDILDINDYEIVAFPPGTPAAARYQIAITTPGGLVNYGELQVNLSALGVKTFDLSGLNLTGYPTTFGPDVLIQWVNPISSVNVDQATWWPDFGMRFNSNPLSFVTCLIGPCDAP